MNAPDAGITIRLGSVEEEEGKGLMMRQQDELLLHNPALPPLPTTNLPVFLIVRKEGGQAIACGGLRPISEDEGDAMAEIKRMYVMPEARGRSAGVSAVLLKTLEDHARLHGWTTLRLQTGTSMGAANAFYQRHGYVLIPNYGEFVEDKETVSFEKNLV